MDTDSAAKWPSPAFHIHHSQRRDSSKTRFEYSVAEIFEYSKQIGPTQTLCSNDKTLLKGVKIVQIGSGV